MPTIQIHCKNCNTNRTVERTDEIPDDVISIQSNTCLDCSVENGIYEETYIYESEHFNPDSTCIF